MRDARTATTQFAYDPVGNLLTLTDPRGNATGFTYDSLSRVKTRTSPLGRTESYQYDLNGNVIQYTDRRGQTSNFQYDPLNRLVNEAYQDGAVVTRAYDPYSRLLTVNDSVGGFYTFGYDLNGSLITQAEPTGSINYTRDQLHRVATRQVLGQSLVTYTYDPVGNVLAASMPGAGITYSYDARNLLTSTSRTNGVVTNYTFDPLGRVLSLIHSKSGTALNTQIYSYDQAGNRENATIDIGQPLITQAAAGTVDQANELLSNGLTTYTNDPNGNRLTETSAAGTNSYQWDGRNRLSSIVDGSGNRTAFKYDFVRNLTQVDKTSGGITAQRFVFDGLTNVASLTDASGLPVSVLTGTAIDSHIASADSAGNVTFGIGDPLGTTTATTDPQGSVSTRLDYEPYGQATGSGPVSYPFTYTGRVPVAGNILYYRNRFYDAGTGRFLSEDPSDIAAGDSNLYRYARDAPQANTDALGLQTANEYICQGLGAAVGGMCAGLPTPWKVALCLGTAAVATVRCQHSAPLSWPLPPPCRLGELCFPVPPPPGEMPPSKLPPPCIGTGTGGCVPGPSPAECEAAKARGQCLFGCGQ